jgi:hypothetical protein
MDLREGLGRYPPRRGRTFSPLALTLHDVGELLRRAACQAGFAPEREWGPGQGGIDWVWFHADDDRNPVIAIEIEGPAVPEESLRRDAEKFASCSAEIKVLLLFTVSRDFTHKPNPPFGMSAEEHIRRFLRNPDVRIMLDADLMKPGGIEALQQEALEAAALRLVG